MNAGDVMTLLGALAIIILMVTGAYYATRWYAKRAGGAAIGLGKYIKVIDRAQMGAASLLIVEINGQYYLIGLSEKNIQLLCDLDDFVPREPEAPTNSSFGQIFSELLKRRKKDSDSGGDI